LKTVQRYSLFLKSTISKPLDLEMPLAKSLKQKNQPQLVTFVLVNVIGLAVIALGLSHLLAVVEGLSKGNWAILGKLIAIPAVLALLTGILGWAMPNTGEEALVFWKVGKHSLPSSRAFSVVGPDDPRVDMQRLVLKHGLLPTSPVEQTALWYRIYRNYAADISVEDAHGAYLRFREMTTLALALFVSCIAFFLCMRVPGKSLGLASAVLIIEYLFLMVAARNAATHFVSNVLALESSAP
jgi:hypothetical protein